MSKGIHIKIYPNLNLIKLQKDNFNTHYSPIRHINDYTTYYKLLLLSKNL